MIVFRADGNSIVGMGHVMRCLSIADAYRKNGESCLFVTADDKLNEVIQERGHGNRILGTCYDQMEQELGMLEEIIGSYDVRIMFVDSYFVTELYLRELLRICRSRGTLLVYLDDVLMFPYPCDVLLNYNIYASNEAYEALYRGTLAPELLLGTDYAPQREEFQGLPDRVVRQEGKDILISTGGADSEHIGLELIKNIIEHAEWRGYRFHFVVGAMNADKKEICSLAMGQRNIAVYRNVKRMSELMRACDVAISAAGSTMYELCSTQTPTLTYVLADNQIPGAEGFEKKQILKCIGDVRELGSQKLAETLLQEAILLLNDEAKRRTIAEKMKMVIDGRGADRIAEQTETLWMRKKG